VTAPQCISGSVVRGVDALGSLHSMRIPK
jgi:hypothetical protein